jgi:hypothetical protein
MNTDDLTIGQVKEISKMIGIGSDNKYKFITGQKICIRGVTMIYTGIVEEDYDDFVTLSKACWIADTGRWSKFLENPVETVKESEMYPNGSVIPVSKGIITDVCIIGHIVLETK